MKRCIKCVLPESFPNISFDKNGLCNYCKNEIGAKEPYPEEIKVKFSEEIDRILQKRNKRSFYDVLIGISGGKDSAILTYILKQKYALRILGYTFDNDFSSPIAKQNIKRLTERLNIDHTYYSLKNDLLKKILKYFITNDSGLLFQKFCPICGAIYGLISRKLARSFRIPYIIFGWTYEQDQRVYYKVDKTYFHRSLWMPDELFWEGLEEDDRKYIWDLYADNIPTNIPYHFRFLISRICSRRTFKYFMTRRPEVITPFKVFNYNPGEYMDKVKQLGLIKNGNQYPFKTNCFLTTLFQLQGFYKLGYNPYVHEYSIQIRRGLYNREFCLNYFEKVEQEIYNGKFHRERLENIFYKLDLDYDEYYEKWRNEFDESFGN